MFASNLFLLTLERRRVALRLRREKVVEDGDLGEDGLEKWNNLGLMDFFEDGVLHWSFGLLGTDEVAVWLVATVVRHRRLGLGTG